MEFRTQIPLQAQRYNQIDYSSKMVLFGSCFSENISKKLHYYKFQHVVNPFGILFHPKAIETLLVNAINEKEYAEKDIFFHNERWHCFDAHSAISATKKEVLLTSLNEAIALTNRQLHEASHIVITLGTAWAYRHIASDAYVANCHKIPQKEFLKELLTVQQLTESLEAICSLIRHVNSQASVLYTISPVKHLKDGFIENTQSKAHLISAVHQVADPRKNLHYFPAYEIVMDELRDYRFYREDMAHPNQTAINYIWERFSRVWFSENTFDTMRKIETIQKGLSHKPFNVHTKQHQDFLATIGATISTLQKQYPFMSF